MTRHKLEPVILCIDLVQIHLKEKIVEHTTLSICSLYMQTTILSLVN